MSEFKGFVGGSFQSASLPADAQESTNLYPERVESGLGRVPWALRRRPGLHHHITLPATPLRGLWAGYKRLFAAAGTKLYEVFADDYTELGTIADDAAHSPVQMFPNGTQLYVVGGGQAYLHDGLALTQLVIGDDTGVRTGAFLDTFFIANPPESKQYYISASKDGTSWDAADVNSKEGYPDNINAIFADHEELWLLGNETLEAHRNEGGADFPFARDATAFNHQGLAACWSPTRLAESFFLLAGDARGRAVAVHMQGFQGKRVSTHCLEALWATYPTVEDAVGYPYIVDGHQFWVLNFPSGDATWVYDAMTGFWHKWTWWDGANEHRHRGICHAYVGIANKGEDPTTAGAPAHFVGDWENGEIYTASDTFGDDFGGDIHYVRTAPYVGGEDNNRVFNQRLQVDIETGDSTLAADLNTSSDFSHTWSSTKTASAGTAGNYTKRVIWRRVGESRHRLYRVSLTTQAKFSVVGAWLRGVAGNS